MAETGGNGAAAISASAKNVYSQFGEDGIIQAILGELPKETKDGWCVEFGAWDGVHLSNTRNLIENHDYRAVLIEADIKKFKNLKQNTCSSKHVLIREFVNFEGHNTLDNMLLRANIPTNFDFLSIDIDGNDYHIFESLIHFRPKLICIEFNPSIPNEVVFVQRRDFKTKHGASAKALLQLAESKNYALVAATACNLFFLDKSLLSFLGMQNGVPLESCRDDSSSRYFLFCGYDGTIFCDRQFPLVWHRATSILKNSFQVLPAFLRKYPDDYNFLERRFFEFWRSVSRFRGIIR